MFAIAALVGFGLSFVLYRDATDVQAEAAHTPEAAVAGTAPEKAPDQP